MGGGTAWGVGEALGGWALALLFGSRSVLVFSGFDSGSILDLGGLRRFAEVCGLWCRLRVGRGVGRGSGVLIPFTSKICFAVQYHFVVNIV